MDRPLQLKSTAEVREMLFNPKTTSQAMYELHVRRREIQEITGSGHSGMFKARLVDGHDVGSGVSTTIEIIEPLFPNPGEIQI